MLIDAVGSIVARVLVLGGEILAIVMTLLRTRESYVLGLKSGAIAPTIFLLRRNGILHFAYDRCHVVECARSDCTFFRAITVFTVLSTVAMVFGVVSSGLSNVQRVCY